MPTSGQLITHYAHVQQESDRLVKELNRLSLQLTQAEKAAVEKQHKVIVLLSEAYLPELTPEHLTACARRTGFRRFATFNPLEAMAHEKERHEHVIAAIEADPAFIERRKLVGPHGKLTRQWKEAQEMAQPWIDECAVFQAHEGFVDLFESGYDTPSFEHQWWTPTYWKRWATGDRICRDMGENDFGDDILPAYRRVYDEREKWLTQVRGFEKKIDHVHHLVRQRDDAQSRIENLPIAYLKRCRVMLEEFLLHADPGLLHEWAEGDRAVHVLLRRWAAEVAKAAHLFELREHAVAPFAIDLRARSAKAARKIRKFRLKPSKARYERIRPGFDDKVKKYDGRIDKWRQLSRRMSDYDATLSEAWIDQPQLWFREMTGSRPPRQLTALRQWYDRNPDVRVPSAKSAAKAAEKQRQAQAAALSAAYVQTHQAADQGYIS